MARLVVISGEDRGLEYKIDREAVLGRHSANAIPLPDTKISRQHSRVFYSEEHYYVEDMGSRNGTLVNGNPVLRQMLDAGDLITVGSTGLVFFPDDASPKLEEILSRFTGAEAKIGEGAVPKEISARKTEPPLRHRPPIHAPAKRQETLQGENPSRVPTESSLPRNAKSTSRFAFLSRDFRQNPFWYQALTAAGVLCAMAAMIAISRWLTLWLLY